MFMVLIPNKVVVQKEPPKNKGKSKSTETQVSSSVWVQLQLVYKSTGIYFANLYSSKFLYHIFIYINHANNSANPLYQ